MNDKTKSNFQPTEEMIRTTERLFAAMALLELVKLKVMAYKTEILRRRQFKTAPRHSRRGKTNEEPTVITDPTKAWLMSDEDFKVYDADCERARGFHDLQVKKPGNCPLLEAEHLVTQAERLLIEVMKPITNVGQEMLFKPENRDKYIELTLRLLSPYVRDADEVLESFEKK